MSTPFPLLKMKAAVIIAAVLSLCFPITGFALTIECAAARLTFDESRGSLESLTTLKSGHEYLDADTDRNLWLAVLPQELGGGTIAPSDAGAFRWHHADTKDSGLTLIWEDFNLPAMPEFAVTVTMGEHVSMPALSWKIQFSGLERHSPAVVYFPRLPQIARQEKEILAVPFWMGEMTDRARSLLSPEAGRGIRREFQYPGLLSLQCMAFYQQDGPGLFLAADDVQGLSKGFVVFGDGKEGIGFEAAHYPSADAVQDGRYSPDYAMLTGLFQGDWITAAEIYRHWALEQRWAKESRIKQGKTPEWITNTGYWVWNRGTSTGVLPPALRLQNYLDVPVSVFWHWWHGCPYDVGFPEYLPPREGSAAFRDAVKEARSHGINPIVYMNQRLWGMTTDSWTAQKAERYAVKQRDGSVRPEIYNTFTQAPNASMCMGTSFWRNTYAALADTVYNDLGVSGIYMDQACSSLICYDTEHDHEPGGGSYWMKGFQQLESDIRRRCPEVGLAGEGCGEAWLPHLDLMLSLQVSRERYAAPGEWEPIPFFHAVYHGYTVLYGNYASLTEPPYDSLWPEEFAPHEPLKLLDPCYRYQFRLEQARSFVWGQQPCLANVTDEVFEERPEDLAYLRQLVQLRQAALPWLLHGRFLRPPAMDIPTLEIDVSRLSIYAGREGSVQHYRKTVAQYLAAAWQADTGAVAVALANISDVDHPLSFRVTTAAQGLSERGKIFKLLPQEGLPFGSYADGLATVSDMLPAAAVVIYTFESE